MNVKRILSQIRLSVKYHGAIYANSVKIKFNNEKTCELCNRLEAWNLVHVLAECNVVSSVVKCIFNGATLNLIDDWIELLNSNDESILRKVVIVFYKIAEKIKKKENELL